MTRHAAARLIAKTPQGEPIAREVVLAALPAGAFEWHGKPCKWAGTINAGGLTLSVENVYPIETHYEVEFDYQEQTKPRVGGVVMAAYHDGHAYQFGPVYVTQAGGFLLGKTTGDGLVLSNFRIVGAVVRWNFDRDGQTWGVDCPQGAPFSDEWRFSGREEETLHSVKPKGGWV